MYNLVKNELCKIFHKKGIYIYLVLLLIILFFAAFVERNSDTIWFDSTEQYYNELEVSLKEYDLNNQDELLSYINLKTDLDVHNMLIDYNITDSETPEYYYVNEDIREVYYELNQAKYVIKDEIIIESLVEELNDKGKELKNFDWKKKLKEERESLDIELKETTSNEEKKILEDKILAIEYRIKNDIPYAYTDTSEFVSQFIISSQDYYAINQNIETLTYNEKQENAYKTKKYYESKYKIENNIVIENNKFSDFIDSFSYASIDIIIAIVIIAGGIVAEEFNKGTVKQLFVRPYCRSKILISKILASMIAVLLFIIVYSLINIGAIMVTGADIKLLFNPVIIYNASLGKVVEYNVFKYVGMTFLATIPEYLLYLALCFVVAVITTNTVAAIVGCLALQIIPVIIQFNDKVSAFMPYNCVNFNEFLFGYLPNNEYQTLLSSALIAGGTLLVLGIIMFGIFKKKDVKNQ